LPTEHCAANDDASFLAWIDRFHHESPLSVFMALTKPRRDARTPPASRLVWSLAHSEMRRARIEVCQRRFVTDNGVSRHDLVISGPVRSRSALRRRSPHQRRLYPAAWCVASRPATQKCRSEPRA